MKARIIDDINDFKSIERDWKILYKSISSNFFQSFTFNYYSWKHILSKDSKNKLSIIVVSEDNIEVAILPFYICRDTVRFINDVHADFCDILLEKGCEINFIAIINLIKSKYRITKIQLINLKRISILKDQLENYSFNYLSMISISEYSYFTLRGGDFPENSALPSKQRYNIKKIIQKKIGNHQVLSSYFDNPFPRRDIINLRDLMIKLGYRDKKFLDGNWINFLEKLYSNNLLDISLINRNKNVDAISFIMKKGDVFMFWIDLFNDTPRINIYNYIKFVTSLSSSKDYMEIHLGRGLYPYKVRNFKPESRRLFAVHIYFNLLSYILYSVRRVFLKIGLRVYKRVNI